MAGEARTLTIKHGRRGHQNDITSYLAGELSYIDTRISAKSIRPPNHPLIPEIVSNIPPPIELRGGLRKMDHYYPFERMQAPRMVDGEWIYDSFWVPSSTGCTPGAVTKFAKKSGWRFTTRGETKDGNPNKTATKSLRGTRVWRIE